MHQFVEGRLHDVLNSHYLAQVLKECFTSIVAFFRFIWARYDERSELGKLRDDLLEVVGSLYNARLNERTADNFENLVEIFLRDFERFVIAKVNEVFHFVKLSLDDHVKYVIQAEEA